MNLQLGERIPSITERDVGLLQAKGLPRRLPCTSRREAEEPGQARTKERRKMTLILTTLFTEFLAGDLRDELDQLWTWIKTEFEQASWMDYFPSNAPMLAWEKYNSLKDGLMRAEFPKREKPRFDHADGATFQHKNQENLT